MNNTINTTFSFPTIPNFCKKTLKGAVAGAIVGTTVVSIILAQGALFWYLEERSRASGNEPKWPLFPQKGDCELQQFRNLSTCTQPPLFASLESFSFYCIGTITIAGTLIGAVSNTAKKVFT